MFVKELEGWVKCLSAQNTLGVLRGVRAESNSIKTSGDQIFRRNKTTENIMPPYCSCDVIKVCASPDIHIRLETCFKPESPPELAKLANDSMA